MTHTIRRNGQIEQIDCELGSGVYDKNGREIVEGDIVSNGHDTFPVIFASGSLLIFSSKANEGYDLSPYFAEGFQIVGHVEDLK